MKYLLTLIYTSICLPLAAQNFTIDWFTIDGGGGTSTGGGYSLSGTLGQPDAGLHSGGPFTLHGGFWIPFTASAPRLFITKSGPNVIIRWEPVGPGFVLQHNATLFPGGWTDAPSGASNPATILMTAPERFYRLRP